MKRTLVRKHLYSNGGALLIYQLDDPNITRVYTGFSTCEVCHGTGMYTKGNLIEQCSTCLNKFNAYWTLEKGVNKLERGFDKLFAICREAGLEIKQEKLDQHPQWKKLLEYKKTLSKMTKPIIIKEEVYDSDGSIRKSVEYAPQSATRL